VVAGMLQARGENVIGLTMQLWNQRRLPEIQSDKATGRCCSLDDVYDARAVAQILGIPYYVVNFEQQFEDQVVRPFVDEYLAGALPSRVRCATTSSSSTIPGDGGRRRSGSHRHGTLCADSLQPRQRTLGDAAERGSRQGSDLFSIRVEAGPVSAFDVSAGRHGEGRRPRSGTGARHSDRGKAGQPGNLLRPNGDYPAFIDAYFREQGIAPQDVAGDLVTADGHVLGEHAGVHRFTVGQRRGLGVSAGEPLYVIATDPASRRVVVGRDRELLSDRTYAGDVNWISIAAPLEPVRAEVKIRNKTRGCACDDSAHVGSHAR